MRWAEKGFFFPGSLFVNIHASTNLEDLIHAGLNIMALPPEHISIKRHREEEPVDTLCMCYPSPFHLFERKDVLE